MSRSSRRATLFAWTLLIAFILPLLAACGGETTPTEEPAAASPAAEEPPAAEASLPAETSPAAEASPPAEASPADEASPVTDGVAAAAPPEPAQVPLNEKVFIIGYNQSPETLFALETSSSIVSQVLV